VLRRVLVPLFLLIASGPAVAQPTLSEDEALARVLFPGESPRAARRLAAADRLASLGQWAEAITEYQHLLAESGDELVPLDRRHFVQVRRLCHLRIAALPPAALALYRGRVDSQARKWFDQGTASRDISLLRRVVEEAFGSRFAGPALDQLGDLAFERGAFEQAEAWYRMAVGPVARFPLVPDGTLLVPDAAINTPRLHAKLILARWFRGEDYRAEQLLAAYQALHPQAHGVLAGRDGLYTRTLETLIHRPKVLRSHAPESWSTFAGASARNRVLPRMEGALSRLPRLDGPAWTVHLDTGIPGRILDDGLGAGGFTPPAAQAARHPAVYPVLAGGRVYCAGARSVLGFDLATGIPVLHYELPNENTSTDTRLPADVEPSYTLTVEEDRLFVRLGPPLVGRPRPGEGTSCLICLSLQPVADPGGAVAGLASPRERWLVRPSEAAVFEGSPVADGDRILIAVTRFAGVQTHTAIACYDAESGALRWQRDVCTTQELKEGESRKRQHLLTLAGRAVVYSSHSGAVVALDAASGRPLWAIRYPSRGPRTALSELSPRALSPCLFADGRLYVAPADFDRILCLDAESGTPLWQSLRVEVVQLLGVSRGKLVFTTTTPRHGIRAVDADTGASHGGWFQPGDQSDVRTFGRGLLAEDRVYWPTNQGLHVLSLEDGDPLGFDEQIRGNLAAAAGCLVVADALHLSAYLPEAGSTDVAAPGR
jgi:outer membrane protein assembly factor BamB